MNNSVNQNAIYNGENLKIGLLGGTFDPPHYAHIYMANQAIKALLLDKVVFMPCGTPPHKNGKEITQSIHRINMLKIIANKNDNFYIDTYETSTHKTSYTIESIKRISSQMSSSSMLYFIIGADSLMYLEKWYKPKELMEIANFAVIPRSGLSKQECLDKIECLENEFNAKITYIDSDALDISSTEIRNEIADNDTYELIDDEVKEYIIENGLYK